MAGGHRVKPGHQVEQRRLAGPVRSDDRMDLGRLDLKVDTTDDLSNAEILAHLLELDRRLGHIAILALTAAIAVL